MRRIAVLIVLLCAACTDPETSGLAAEACQKWNSLPFPSEIVDVDGTRYTFEDVTAICGEWKGGK